MSNNLPRPVKKTFRLFQFVPVTHRAFFSPKLSARPKFLLGCLDLSSPPLTCLCQIYHFSEHVRLFERHVEERFFQRPSLCIYTAQRRITASDRGHLEREQVRMQGRLLCSVRCVWESDLKYINLSAVEERQGLFTSH